MDQLATSGISDFDALHSNKHNNEGQLYFFDLMPIGGEDLRGKSFVDRKWHLDKLLRSRAHGVFLAPFERGEIGPELFTAACRMRLEGSFQNISSGAIGPAPAMGSR